MFRPTVIERLLEKKEEKDFLEVPFIVPEGLSQLAVRCEVIVRGQSREASVIDLGVRDSRNIRGWSGGARNEFYIGTDRATPGYTAGELVPGEWAVILGAYKIAAAGCLVRLTLTFEVFRRPKIWLAGDLHMHTIHSDGAYTAADNVSIAAHKGLDFIGAMDHNVTTQYEDYIKAGCGRILVMPGMELTTYQGHCNLLGAPDPVRDFRVRNRAEMIEKIHEAHAGGALVSINHPFDEGCPWNYGLDLDYDAVEVWNGPWRPCNEQAVCWWHEQLVSGRRIPAVGGSDVHRPEFYTRHGMPTTFVFAGRSVSDLLEGIRKGHVFISYAPDGPTIDLKAGEALPGDVAASGEKIGLRLGRLTNGDRVKIISDRQTEYQCVIGSNRVDFTYEWRHETGRRFYRIEVWRSFPERALAAMSNPIYFDGEQESAFDPFAG